MSSFPTTQWTAVLNAGGTNSDIAFPHLEKLCQTYWFPLFSYVRCRGYQQHAAEDLTQAFFTHLIENNALQQVGGERGRFRSFLLASLNHFLLNEWDKASAQKRGGKIKFTSWDEMVAEDIQRDDPADGLTPERIYERKWVYTTIQTAILRLKSELQTSGKLELYAALEPYLIDEPPAGFYEAFSKNSGFSEGALKTQLYRWRRQFGELLRREIAHTVSSPDQVEEEVRHLLSVLG